MWWFSDLDWFNYPLSAFLYVTFLIITTLIIVAIIGSGLLIGLLYLMAWLMPDKKMEKQL